MLEVLDSIKFSSHLQSTMQVGEVVLAMFTLPMPPNIGVVYRGVKHQIRARYVYQWFPTTTLCTVSKKMFLFDAYFVQICPFLVQICPFLVQFCPFLSKFCPTVQCPASLTIRGFSWLAWWEKIAQHSTTMMKMLSMVVILPRPSFMPLTECCVFHPGATTFHRTQFGRP